LSERYLAERIAREEKEEINKQLKPIDKIERIKKRL